MPSINRAVLIGHVGKDPEIKTFSSGNKVANITLATSERYKDRDGNQKEETEWHTVQAFGKLADIVEQYVRRGYLLYVDGKIRTRSYDADGRTIYKTEIVANTIQMLSKPFGPDQPRNAEPAPEPEPDPAPKRETLFSGDSDLPF